MWSLRSFEQSDHISHVVTLQGKRENFLVYLFQAVIHPPWRLVTGTLAPGWLHPQPSSSAWLHLLPGHLCRHMPLFAIKRILPRFLENMTQEPCSLIPARLKANNQKSGSQLVEPGTCAPPETVTLPPFRRVLPAQQVEPRAAGPV